MVRAACWLAAIIALFLLTGVVGDEVARAGSGVPGDVNCDNQLTVIDPLELLKRDAGLPADDA
jgi:hypothetical protein